MTVLNLSLSLFSQDQPGSEPVDVVSQPDISDIEDPVVNIQFGQFMTKTTGL